MKINQLNNAQKVAIEKVGVMYQKSGMSPAAARVLSLLMIVDEAELTFEKICSILSLSKSAVSNAINSLLIMERIEYYTKPGDRKRYFFVNMSKLKNLNEGLLQKIANAALMYREIISVRTKANPQFNANLKLLAEFMDFLKVELTESLKKWDKRK